MIRVYSVSLGCPKNRVDTERTLGRLGSVRTVTDPRKADLVFINTCGFIAPAVEESVRTLLETLHEVAALPADARPVMAAAGCLVGRYGAATLAPDLPDVDLLLEPAHVATWSESLLAALAARAPAGAPRTVLAGPAGARLLSTPPSYAWLKISDGCRHTCSFCTIPAIRGPFQSAPEAALEEEARALLGLGVRELVLVAQDVTAWGRDNKKDLRSLLERLLPLPGLERLRLMYLYPAGLTRDLLAFLKDAGPPFVPYFDVPLQHASEHVLARMGRPFARNPHEVVERIRSFFPQAALRTSLITGFPGETEDDFRLLSDFVAAVRFHHLGVFAYQAEEGTPAAAMPHQIPEREKSWRRDSLMHMQEEISEEILQSYVGARMEVLVDAPQGEWPGLFTGRTWFQAPESDGMTYVSGKDCFPGACVRAEITEAAAYDLVALADPVDDA